jgi:hypothetical protein
MAFPTGDNYWNMIKTNRGIEHAQATANKALEVAEENAKKLKMNVAGKEIWFTHTAVNRHMHLFVNGHHDPAVCPECIQPGILTTDPTPQHKSKG